MRKSITIFEQTKKGKDEFYWEYKKLDEDYDDLGWVIEVEPEHSFYF